MTFFNFLNPSKINTSVNFLHRLETKKIIMNIKEKIQATTTFKELTKKTSFLKKNTFKPKHYGKH